jgi:sulfoxide reductase heme-binding subunit YedZ
LKPDSLVDPWPEGPARRNTRVLKDAPNAERALQRTVKRWAHPVVVLLGLLPAVVLLADALNGRLGANPIEAITHRTGDWTIWLLLGTLAVTPIRRLSGRNELIRFRRTIGLLTFGYACTHFLIYVLLDREFLFDPALAVRTVGEDIAERPYITVGFTAFLLLIPLAVTSTKGWIRRLGSRWSALHRVVYVAGALGVLHYLWLVKGEQNKPVWHGLVLIALLGFRVWDGRRSRRRAPPAPPAPSAPSAPPVSPPRSQPAPELRRSPTA